MPKITSVKAVELQIATLAGEFGILRAKGRLSVDGKALPLVVQAVGQRVDSYFARASDGAIGQLVVIGLAGLDGMAIAKRLDGQLLGDQMHDDGLAGHASS